MSGVLVSRVSEFRHSALCGITLLHMAHVLTVFTKAEIKKVQLMLEDLVRALRIVPGGGKMEEGYWSYIYETVRGAPSRGWSNLTMRDYCHAGLGVEMKLLGRKYPLKDQGKRLMHPSATRTVAFNPSDGAEACKDAILQQLGLTIGDFRERVYATCEDGDPLIRWGVLLWSKSLEEFLYFEEEMIEPDPAQFTARFEKGMHRGNPTENLYIYERGTDIKRYSVTLPDKGAKLQPYFDIPKIGAGAYVFNVPKDDRRAVWLKSETIAALEAAASGQELDALIRHLLSANL
jgi:hypothetical protein